MQKTLLGYAHPSFSSYKKMNQLLKTLVVFPIRLYKIFLSPLLGANKCRYSPTCSQYMIDAIFEWGILRGLFMGVKRILRCHPWSNHAHIDPVPKRENFTSSK
ncbi:MAG: membrane protein insertion efficiency factor YidD [Saprospiraceae bacterium]|nr:membrane protein insertion efficiency factor YidD [Saprospiraceae bacterium]